MDDLLKKALLFGVGATAITKEKAEQFVKQLRKRDQISAEEGKKLVRELMRVSEKRTKETARLFHNELNKVISEVGSATKRDMQDIEKKLKTKSQGRTSKKSKRGCRQSSGKKTGKRSSRGKKKKKR